MESRLKHILKKLKRVKAKVCIIELGAGQEPSPFQYHVPQHQLAGYQHLKLFRVPAHPEPFVNTILNKPDDRQLEIKDPIFEIYRENVVKVRIGPFEILNQIMAEAEKQGVNGGSKGGTGGGLDLGLEDMDRTFGES